MNGILLFLFTFNSLACSLNVSTSGQTEVVELRRELRMMEQRLQALEAKCNSSAQLQQQRIGFTACLSSSSGVSVGFHQTIPFDNVITNNGNGFDSRHGAFRAPVSGLYHFSITIYSTKTNPMLIQMVKDGVELIHTYVGDSDYLSSSKDVIVWLNAGQDVWCRNRNRPNAVIMADNNSCFSGHLISI
ncbi:complement C1q tumor necrosis factor-related protein 6-like [Saccostrea cucullata]|uniref:complement C1q tumor necrosis factor-related protein 6-like n=1 Tax=Saccostrea cuccullata TaxID=36930 RepID=UPI002ED0E8B3